MTYHGNSDGQDAQLPSKGIVESVPDSEPDSPPIAEVIPESVTDSNPVQEPIRDGVQVHFLTELRRALETLGYSVDSVGGNWTFIDYLALKKFQSDNGLESTGVVDLKTAKALGLD